MRFELGMSFPMGDQGRNPIEGLFAPIAHIRSCVAVDGSML